MDVGGPAGFKDLDLIKLRKILTKIIFYVLDKKGP